MKQQFVELLSDIGFVKEGIVAKDVERAARSGGDGIATITGEEVMQFSSPEKRSNIFVTPLIFTKQCI